MISHALCQTLKINAWPNTALKAIAYGELSKKDSHGNLRHHHLLLDSLAYAKSNAADFPEVDVIELAVEVATIKLAHRVAPYITGYIHVQANPRYCYDKPRLIKNARSTIHQHPQLYIWAAS
jgi:hypothetical protein